MGLRNYGFDDTAEELKKGGYPLMMRCSKKQAKSWKNTMLSILISLPAEESILIRMVLAGPTASIFG